MSIRCAELDLLHSLAAGSASLLIHASPVSCVTNVSIFPPASPPIPCCPNREIEPGSMSEYATEAGIVVFYVGQSGQASCDQRPEGYMGEEYSGLRRGSARILRLGYICCVGGSAWRPVWLKQLGYKGTLQALMRTLEEFDSEALVEGFKTKSDVPWLTFRRNKLTVV